MTLTRICLAAAALSLLARRRAAGPGFAGETQSQRRTRDHPACGRTAPRARSAPTTPTGRRSRCIVPVSRRHRDRRRPGRRLWQPGVESRGTAGRELAQRDGRDHLRAQVPPRSPLPASDRARRCAARDPGGAGPSRRVRDYARSHRHARLLGRRPPDGDRRHALRRRQRRRGRSDRSRQQPSRLPRPRLSRDLPPTSRLPTADSFRNLLGENPDRKLLEQLSPDLQVTPQTPPTFLFHTERRHRASCRRTVSGSTWRCARPRSRLRCTSSRTGRMASAWP